MQALLIFIKNPIKGTVKTRLAKSVGDDKALAIYQQLLAHTRTISTALSDEVDKLLFYSQYVAEDEWMPSTYHKKVQIKGDLGAKMTAAFGWAFTEGYEKVCIIGSDCADLTTAHLEAAFAALENHDFVIGPALDGGYYLIGMRQFQPQVFTNKQWSTESVFSDTQKDIEELAASVYLLEPLSDIDYVEDWERRR